MDIQATKLKLMQLLLNTQKEQVLKQIEAIFEKEEVDFWEELDPNLQASIERGLSQSAKGQVKSHEEVMKKYKQWL